MLCSLLPVKYASANGKFRVAHHAQIALNAAVQHHAGLGFALGHDLDDARLRDKKFDHFRRLFGRRQQINVADDFLEPPQAARRRCSE